MVLDSSIPDLCLPPFLQFVQNKMLPILSKSSRYLEFELNASIASD